MLTTLMQDFRYALRMLAKSPGFTAVAVLTLALGIGANTAVCSMVNALLLHPYNFRDLDRLVRVWEDRGLDEGYDARWIAPADAADLRASTPVFESFSTYAWKSFSLADAGNVEPVLGCRVLANFFDVLGVSPAIGRAFTVAEEQPGSDQIAVISDGFWRRRFGRDPNLLGKTIRLNGRTYTVVGIMPPGFDYPVPVELWVPLALTPEEKADRTGLSLSALARLKPEVTLPQARAALAAFSQRLAQQYPMTNSGRSVTLLQLRKELYLYTLPLFFLLQAAAGLVLLLACANLINVVFARMIARQKEMAIRTALGAGRRRLAQLCISEMLLLSSISGAVAVAVSLWSVKALRTSIPIGWTKWVPGWDGIEVDTTVLAFAVLLAVGVGLSLGLATVFHSSRVDLNAKLKEAGSGSLTPARARLRSALVVVQVMFALVLLVCAGLTIQGFARLANVYQGFQPATVLRVELSLPEKNYSDNTKIVNFYQQVLRGTAVLPGVSAAALVTNSPASNVDNETTFFTIEGRPALRANEAPSADLQTSTPDYFSALRIPAVSGRVFAGSDNADAARVALISRSLAAQFWPAGDALGHRVKLGAPDSVAPWMTVVGIVADVRQNWWNPASRPVIYRPFLQSPERSMTLLLRGSSAPTSYVPSVRDVVRQADPEIALHGVASLEDEVADSIAIVRIMGVLMGVFGFVALALASLGVYGVLSESVAQRTREIGIRLALGARPGALRRLVLGQALKLTCIGLAIALPVSFAAGRAMAGLIFGIVTIDFAVLAGFAALLIAVALAAGYFPARRATRIDPLTALRYE